MKKTFMTVLLLTAFAAVAPAQQYIDGEPVYRVNNEREFIEALGPDRIVEIGPDVQLNLTRVLNDESLFSGVAGRDFLPMVERGTITTPTVVSEDAYNGRQLTLVHIDLLTIRGAHNSSIVVEPRYANVFNFVDCEGTRLENLTIGHTDEGYCTGAVISYIGGRVNVVKSCDLYGCGSYGLLGDDTNSLGVSATRIHHCTNGIMQFYGSPGLRFDNCDFFDNGHYTLVECDKSDLAFTSCRFYRNAADQQLFSGYYGLVLLDCDIYHPVENLGRTENLLEPREPNRYHDVAEGQYVQPRAIGPDVSE
ncbi:MAG: right-handed parallel beta-helix repeat-containing protein [Prevotella sp.]|nr:right-handed parallel beta-helix repeat-containing protein [Prevotella sp.]